jgi:hypothetical protein
MLNNFESKYKIKPYQDGDEDNIIPLFEKVYGRLMGKTESYQHWRWEFLENPVKPVSIMLAWHRQRLIGHYAVNPLRAWVLGQELLVSLSLDTMTDKDYEKKGIFSNTAKCLYDQIVSNGVSFVFGFPNAQSIGGFLKRLGWHILSPVAIYICPLDVGPFMKSKTKSDYLGLAASKISRPTLRILVKYASKKYYNDNIEVRKEDKFGSWSDELWLRCRNQHALWIVRDLKYLSWRYDMRPESNNEIFTAWFNSNIAGYVITTSQTRNEGRVSFILDMLADVNVNGTIEALLKAVINSSIKNNDAMISALLMPDSLYRSVFKKFSFFPLPKRLFPHEIYFGGRLLNNNISTEIFYNPASWHISWGDTDLL